MDVALEAAPSTSAACARTRAQRRVTEEGIVPSQWMRELRRRRGVHGCNSRVDGACRVARC